MSNSYTPPPAPMQLRCNLFREPEQAMLHSTKPRFSWVILAPHMQTAYQIQVASTAEQLQKSTPDLWDSGIISSGKSLAVPYGGGPLITRKNYFWRLRFWDGQDQQSDFSTIQQFCITKASTDPDTPGEGYRLQETRLSPTRIVELATDHYFIDFGKAAFGTIEITVSEKMAAQALTIHLGEKCGDSNRIDKTPPGTVRYQQLTLITESGRTNYRLVIPPDERNTGRRTIKMPPETSEVLPFRYCEIEGWTGPLSAQNIRQIVVHYPFDAHRSSFTSSDKTLNALWDLCKYTIKATSFCGIYVDGDRERFPREADAYINQLSHYAVDSEYTLARRTHELMLTHTSQWTEWILQSIFMAWADYVYTGDSQTLAKWYPLLQEKSLTALAGTDGLISTSTGLVTDLVRKSIFYFEGEHVWGPELKDIVDWPYCERDEFDFQDYNTVVNAFYYQGLRLLSQIATVLDKKEAATHYTSQAERVFQAVNTTFVNPDSGVYVDGKGSTHSSLHANIFPLAFGLVLPQNKAAVISHIKTKGMACSVYGAQYLLEALYQNDESNYALELMTQKSNRSWYNMLESGSTMTLEAWDEVFKPNLDWNHAWGSAPVNIISRFILGVTPLKPGFSEICFAPQPGKMETFSGTIPTIRGSVFVHFQKTDTTTVRYELTIPGNTLAEARLPIPDEHYEVRHNQKKIKGEIENNRIVFKKLPPGQNIFEIQTNDSKNFHSKSE